MVCQRRQMPSTCALHCFLPRWNLYVHVRRVLDDVRTGQDVPLFVNEEACAAGQLVALDFERELKVELGRVHDDAYNRVINIVGDVLGELAVRDGGRGGTLCLCIVGCTNCTWTTRVR